MSSGSSSSSSRGCLPGRLRGGVPDLLVDLPPTSSRSAFPVLWRSSFGTARKRPKSAPGLPEAETAPKRSLFKRKCIRIWSRPEPAVFATPNRPVPGDLARTLFGRLRDVPKRPSDDALAMISLDVQRSRRESRPSLDVAPPTSLCHLRLPTPAALCCTAVSADVGKSFDE